MKKTHQSYRSNSCFASFGWSDRTGGKTDLTTGPIVIGLIVLFTVLMTGVSTGQYSRLWGERGERWSPGSRLPDFSFVGYRHGERSIPEPDAVTSVTRLGARPDDGNDDTEAFQKAVKQASNGAVYVPPGKYIITDRVVIRRSNVVLRGAGQDETVLFFPKPLSEIDPDPAETAHGESTSNYSWSGGFLKIVGGFQGDEVCEVTAPAERGEQALQVELPDAFQAGQTIRISLENEGHPELIDHIYGGQPGNTDRIGDKLNVFMVATVVRVQGNTIYINRPLRFRIQSDWDPVIHRFQPKVTESGIENMTLAFPKTPYEGHFEEKGFNGIDLWEVVHCWVRNIRFHNADSGMFADGAFSTYKNLIWTSDRKLHDGRLTGHHGITMGGNSDLLTKFEFRCRYIHDITMTHNSGNVASDGRGKNLSLDHHRRGPFANLFTNLDAGRGTRLWKSGGGGGWGKHCAAWTTFWNIRADNPIPSPPDKFAPDLINLVDVESNAGAESTLNPEGFWRENFPSNKMVRPKNLHRAQLERRLQNR